MDEKPLVEALEKVIRYFAPIAWIRPFEPWIKRDSPGEWEIRTAGREGELNIITFQGPLARELSITFAHLLNEFVEETPKMLEQIVDAVSTSKLGSRTERDEAERFDIGRERPGRHR